MTSQLNKREKDIFRLLQSNCHIASRNYNVQMKRFINHVNKEGVPIFNIDDTYERIRLAARIIAGVQDLSEVYAISSREYGQRAVIKFASYTKCSVTSSSRWTPGSLTNHQTRQFKEPKVIIVADPYADFKAIKEASYANIPVIALCDSHNNLKFVDLVIPCNNNSTESISMVFWMLAREVLTLRGLLDREDDDWSDVLVDLFYYKDVNERRAIEEAGDAAVEDEEEAQQDEEEAGDWNEANN
jgi:small subunit ribosomal protein SAe